MRAPLHVSIDDGVQVLDVTKYTKGLTFRKTAPGGHESAAMTINRPLATFPNLGPADRCTITNGETGRVIWGAGYTENPGQQAGGEGESFQLSVQGGMALASDQAERLIYLDRTLDDWRTDDYHGQFPSAEADAGQYPDGSGTRAGQAALVAQFQSGQPPTTNSQTGLVYDDFKGSVMQLGGIAGYWLGGTSDTGYKLELIAEPEVGGDPIVQISLSTTGAAVFALCDGTTLPPGRTGIVFRLRRSGAATNVTTEKFWGALGEVAVLGQLVDRNGTARNMATFSHVNTAATPVSAYVLASEVAEDLLGRLLKRCNAATAQIDATTAQIDQLAFAEPTRAADVFGELLRHEPDFDWGIGATDAAGMHAFWWRAWPTVPRYRISTTDGYDAPGDENPLCNRVAVTWSDAKGVTQVTMVGIYVPELGDRSPILNGVVDPAFVGRIKDADPINLPDGTGSAANALRVGTQLLTRKADAPKSGTATIDRPLQDLYTGLEVMPWQLEPGYPALVQETGEVQRLTVVEYDDDQAAANLTLGSPLADDEDLIADLLARRTA